MKLYVYGKEDCDQCLTVVDFNEQLGFYKCLKCGYSWVYDNDVPDYSDVEFYESLENCVHFKLGHCMNSGTTIGSACQQCPRY
jgi:hypothetical protein